MNAMRLFLSLALIAIFSLAPISVFAQQAATSTPFDADAVLKQFLASSTPTNPESSFVPRTSTDSLPDGIELPTDFNKVPITIEITPEFPGPEQEVTAEITSYSTKLATNKIAWYVNNRLIEQGTGITKISFKTGKFGVGSAISVNVLADNGFSTRTNLTVVPTQIDLVWQAETYTPPFYKGKALFSHQSPVKVVAIPTIMRPGGSKISADSLVYRWEYNDKVLAKESGLGKNTITIQDQIPSEDSLIRVDVSTIDQSIKARGLLRLTSTEPLVLLYEEGPIGIKYEKALGARDYAIGSDTKISAIPYFFSVPKKNTVGLTYKWILNGKDTTNRGSSVIIGPGKTEGRASVELEITAVGKMFQKNNTELPINLSGTKATGSIF